MTALRSSGIFLWKRARASTILAMSSSVQKTKAMPRLDVGEAQADDACSFVRRRRVDTAALQLLQQLLIGRDIIGGHEGQLLEERMIRRQILEQLDRIGRDLQTHSVKIDVKVVLAQHRAEIGMRRQFAIGHHRPPHAAEQQVFTNGGLRVIGIQLERNDEVVEIFLLQIACARPDATRRCGRSDRHVSRSIDSRTQRHVENVLRNQNRIEHRAHDLEEIVRPGHARGDVVHPVAVNVEFGIAGAARLVDVPFVLRRSCSFILDLGQGRMLEAVKQIVAQRSVEEVSIGGCIGDAPAGDRFRQFEDVLAIDGDAALLGPDEPGKGLGKGFRAAAAVADDSNGLARFDLQRDMSEQGAPLSSESVRLTACKECSRRLTASGTRAWICGSTSMLDVELFDDLSCT